MKKFLNKQTTKAKSYWPLVKEMSQITLLLFVGFFGLYKYLTSTDIDMQKIWGGVVIAAFLFSLVPMYVATVKSLLPKGK